MTRSRDIADQQDNLGGAVAPWVGAKNFFINGSMDIAQRGTTFTGVANVYTLDRWYFEPYGAATTANVSQGSSDSVPGFRYYAKVAANSATSSNFNFSQTIETANVIPLRGKTVTVSFYLRTPVAFSNVFVWELRYSTSTDVKIGNAGTGTLVGASSGFTPTSTWTRYSQTYTIPSDASSLGFIVGTYNNTVSTANFDITGVQLELGSQATPFARSGGSIGGELALCQRYYYRFGGATGYERFSTLATGASSTSLTATITAPTTMRVAPTSVDFATLAVWDGANLSAVTNLTLAVAGKQMQELTVTVGGGGITQYRPYYLLANNSTNAYLGLSAEL